MYVCLVYLFMGTNRVWLPIMLVVSWTGKLFFPVPVRDWEFGLLGQVRLSCPASARSFSTLWLTNHQSSIINHVSGVMCTIFVIFPPDTVRAHGSNTGSILYCSNSGCGQRGSHINWFMAHGFHLPIFSPLLIVAIHLRPSFFFFFNLTYSRWTSSLPSCLWWQRIFPSLPGSRLTISYRDASSALLQLVNQWLNFTYSRSHAFRYEIKEVDESYFGKNRTHDFRTGRCAGYLLDHSS